jgi:MoxR-like ATPase
MKIKIGYPTRQEEKEIINRMGTLGPLPTVDPIINEKDIFHFRDVVNEIYMDDKVIDYLLNIIESTRAPQQFSIKIEGLLEYGASPRASIALKNASRAKALLAGRYFVTPQDIKNICADVLRHRLRLSYEAEAQNLTSDDILNRILDSLPVP